MADCTCPECGRRKEPGWAICLLCGLERDRVLRSFLGHVFSVRPGEVDPGDPESLRRIAEAATDG